MKLDQAVVTRLRQPMGKTWNYIGSDAMEFCTSNAEAIEMCIDAGRLETCGNDKEASQLISELCKEHTYPKVLKFLSKNFRFV